MADTNVFENTVGALRETVFKHTGPASYSTGGETITAAQLGLKSLISVQVSGDSTGAYFTVAKVPATKFSSSFVIIWQNVSDGAEVTATTNLSASTVTIRALGY